MERRLLLVFALTFLVIIFVSAPAEKILPQPPGSPPQQTAVPSPSQSAAAVPAEPVPTAGGRKHAAAETETVVENDF